jgi:hypothetical protein
MNIKKIVLILPVLLLMVTSCGYGSKSECMKEEIRKNGGKNNFAIGQYCNEKFDKKSKKSGKLKEGVDYTVEYREDLGVYVRNYSDSPIRVFKGIGATRMGATCKKLSDVKKIPSDEPFGGWDNEPNFLAGDLIYPGTIKKVVTYRAEQECFWSYVSH